MFVLFSVFILKRSQCCGSLHWDISRIRYWENPRAWFLGIHPIAVNRYMHRMHCLQQAHSSVAARNRQVKGCIRLIRSSGCSRGAALFLVGRRDDPYNNVRRLDVPLRGRWTKVTALESSAVRLSDALSFAIRSGRENPVDIDCFSMFGMIQRWVCLHFSKFYISKGFHDGIRISGCTWMLYWNLLT